MTRLLRSIWNDRAGASALEFAIILPFLLILLAGTVETGRIILQTMKVQRASFTLADLVTRDETLTVAQLNDMFLALDALFEPFDFATEGKAIVSCVSAVSTTVKTIKWQRSGGGTLASTSKLGTVGGVPVLPAAMTLTTGETVVVAEVFYKYTPFFQLRSGSRTIYRVSYSKPRHGTLDTLTP